MKSKKLKQYTLMVARTFPCNHPRKGEDTNFKDLILEGIKEHTCRSNTDARDAYKYWSDAAHEINSGKAVLVLKQWTGKPYYSPQLEFMRLTHIEVQQLYLTYDWALHACVDLDQLSTNDGLQYEDFVFWFFPKKKKIEWKGCIIHFKPQVYKCNRLVKIER